MDQSNPLRYASINEKVTEPVDEDKLLMYIKNREEVFCSFVIGFKGAFDDNKQQNEAKVCEVLGDPYMTDFNKFSYLLALTRQPPNKGPSFRSDRRVEAVMKVINRPVRKYLDFGCCDMSITATIGNELGVEKHNIIGADIINQQANYGITYLKSDRKLANKIGPGTVDLVTAFVVFHHVGPGEDETMLNETIADIVRCMAPGGVLFIREHDIWKWDKNKPTLTGAVINLAHALFDIRDGVMNSQNDLRNLYASMHYRTRDQWHTILVKHGLKEIEGTYEPETAYLGIMQARYHIAYIKK